MRYKKVLLKISRVRVLGIGLFLIFLCLAGCSCTSPVPPPPPPPPPSIPGRRALLIGVTQYDHLPQSHWLKGPGNDVVRLRQILTSYYGFAENDIVCLTEAENSPSHRPTRENIAREFHRLGEVSQEDDQVFILVTGHGDRQPELPQADPEFRQPDGISEIFLPADVQPAIGSPPQAPNAIVDVEFRDWLAQITSKKAYVWVVFDCCHSGDLSRGLEDVRELPPGVLVPVAAFQQPLPATAPTTENGRPSGRQHAFHPPDDSDRLVVLYACRPTERTLEWDFSTNAVPEKHGILSYTLAEVLTNAVREPTRLTYWDVLRRIERKYAARSGWATTPALEGAGQGRFLFEVDKPYLPQFEITESEGVYYAEAGLFHGLTTGSVLRVYKPGNTGQQPEIHGYARVVSTTPFRSVVTPCDFKDHEQVTGLPRLATCDVESLVFAISPLKVAVVGNPGSDQVTGAVRDAVRKVTEKHPALIALNDPEQGADWLIRCDSPTPLLEEASGNRPAVPLPATDSANFEKELDKKLLTIYRARNLIAVGERLQSEQRSHLAKLDFELTMSRIRPGEQEEPVDLHLQAPTFMPDESLKFSVRNKSEQETIAVTLLIVGSDYRITSFYPGWKKPGKTIEPGKLLERESNPYNNAPPFGSEYLVAIAVPARNGVNFSALVQPGLQDRGYTDASPLAQLLEHALDGFGTRSALDRSVIPENVVKIVSWRTAPAPNAP